jgi:hypothetical protein
LSNELATRSTFPMSFFGQCGGSLKVALVQGDVGQVAQRDAEKRGVADFAGQRDYLAMHGRRVRVVAARLGCEGQPVDGVRLQSRVARVLR